MQDRIEMAVGLDRDHRGRPADARPTGGGHSGAGVARSSRLRASWLHLDRCTTLVYRGATTDRRVTRMDSKEQTESATPAAVASYVRELSPGAVRDA